MVEQVSVEPELAESALVKRGHTDFIDGNLEGYALTLPVLVSRAGHVVEALLHSQNLVPVVLGVVE